MTRRARAVGGGLTEAAFQSHVLGLFRFYDWRVYHPPDNRPGGKAGRVQAVAPGYPDLTAVRGVELLFVELKTDGGRLGKGQPEWAAALEQVADGIRDMGEAVRDLAPDDPRFDRLPVVEYHLWRPIDWPMIEERLARGLVRQATPPPV